MKVLFTGITGLLGKYFQITKPKGYKIFGTYKSNLQSSRENFFQLNIIDETQVYGLLKKIMPEVVVHAASIGSVDYCETHKEEAYDVNLKGTKNIVSGCLKIGARVIFTSSNAVYDGNDPPYDEKARLSPLDVYGKTKAEGEKLIERSGVSYSILRLMTMYGWQQTGGRGNPVTWIIDELRNGRQINVVNDIFNNHLYAKQAAEAVWKVIQGKGEKIIYNIAGRECVSRYDLAIKVAKVFNLDASLITPVPNSFFKNIAPRPKNTCFNTNKMEKTLGVRPYMIEEGLREMLHEE